MCIGIVILLVTLILPGMVEGMAAEKIPAPTQFFAEFKWFSYYKMVHNYICCSYFLYSSPNNYEESECPIQTG